MAIQEGVSKFSLSFREESCLTPDMVSSMSGWRYILHRLQLIGQDSGRYMGYGFGNISVRSTVAPGSFIISGTQTGKQQLLQASEYALVTECNVVTNSVSAMGVTRPSSEALTHGQLYRFEEAIGCVVHAHSPDIWSQAEALQLSLTRSDVAYGTTEMAHEVERLLTRTAALKKHIFVMGGHEDGVVSFGSDLREACTIMIETLARAIALKGTAISGA